MNQFVSKHRLVFFYAFAFIISWTAWILMSRVYTGGQAGMLIYLFSSLGGLGPLLSLLLLQTLTRQEINLKDILSKIKIRGVKNLWAVPAIVGIPVITLLGNIGYFILGQRRPTAYHPIRTRRAGLRCCGGDGSPVHCRVSDKPFVRRTRVAWIRIRQFSEKVRKNIGQPGCGSFMVAVAPANEPDLRAPTVTLRCAYNGGDFLSDRLTT